VERKERILAHTSKGKLSLTAYLKISSRGQRKYHIHLFRGGVDKKINEKVESLRRRTDFGPD